jgi:hypothetical protein
MAPGQPDQLETPERNPWTCCRGWGCPRVGLCVGERAGGLGSDRGRGACRDPTTPGRRMRHPRRPAAPRRARTAAIRRARGWGALISLPGPLRAPQPRKTPYHAPAPGSCPAPRAWEPVSRGKRQQTPRSAPHRGGAPARRPRRPPAPRARAAPHPAPLRTRAPARPAPTAARPRPPRTAAHPACRHGGHQADGADLQPQVRRQAAAAVSGGHARLLCALATPAAGLPGCGKLAAPSAGAWRAPARAS